MRVVLDTNIFVSSLITAKGNPVKIVRWWLEGKYDLLVSQPIIDEILRVTSYQRLQKKYARVRENRLEFVTLIKEQATLIEPEKVLSIIDDESDNRYVECALAGNARYIISGDDHLLELKEFEGVLMVNPATFVTLVKSGHA